MPTTTVPRVDFRAVDGLRIRYADSGASREATLLLTKRPLVTLQLFQYPVEVAADVNAFLADPRP